MLVIHKQNIATILLMETFFKCPIPNPPDLSVRRERRRPLSLSKGGHELKKWCSTQRMSGKISAFLCERLTHGIL